VQWRDTCCGLIVSGAGAPLLTLGLPWPSLLSGRPLSQRERWATDFLIYLVIHGGLYNRKKKVRGFTPISYDYIDSVLGVVGHRVMKWLLDMRVFEKDGNWSVGSKAFGYKLSSAALSYGFCVRPMPAVIWGRFTRYWNKRARRRRATVYVNQRRILRTVTLDQAIWPLLLRPQTRRAERIAAVYAILTACHIRNGNWYITDDQRTGRCFTNVSNFRSDLRRYLLIAGRPTGELDIANSQPTLLVSLCYGAAESAERTLALSLVQSGAFYSTICSWAGLQHLSHKKQKERVFAGVMFADNEAVSKLWPAFVKHLPLMAAYVSQVKAAGRASLALQAIESTSLTPALKGRNRLLNGSNALALRLQKLEADIMLGRVFPRLTSMGINALSLHDGCLVAVEHLETVQSVILEEFKTITGIKPWVRLKQPES